ncbi:hypothetical protein MB02_13325 [Croceicoccus estronivorus]|uniref:DUF2239 family protein n=1 Tax=Croceicoccus estronivorus TaxID=1172626 RepID=UPI000835460D|nr:DUF2239 family protein [Croceicoccus estronivorus]OCC23140.1 hypothetical protein MB02_13325 [Croceicoccus estronivorus]
MNKDLPPETLAKPCTAFDGNRKVSSGQLVEVVLYLKPLVSDPHASILIFDDDTGAVLDIDFRGTSAEIIARLAQHPVAQTISAKKRGRPRLGVIGREVTLLPRHWDWLASQKGGASQTLRRLIDKARREARTETSRHLAQERTYRFMSAVAGNYSGFEEASRALFADNFGALSRATEAWPKDVREYTLQLASPTENDSD